MVHYIIFIRISFVVMEVASGEYDVDLEKAAKTMEIFKPEPPATQSTEENIPVISTLHTPISKFFIKIIQKP